MDENKDSKTEKQKLYSFLKFELKELVKVLDNRSLQDIEDFLMRLLYTIDADNIHIIMAKKLLKARQTSIPHFMQEFIKKFGNENKENNNIMYYINDIERIHKKLTKGVEENEKNDS